MTNKELIERFYSEVFNGQDITNLDTYMRDDYKQHNAGVKDGKAGFIEFCGRFLPLQPRMEIMHLITEGDKVCVFFKCTLGVNGAVNKVSDIYRIEDGRLAEHWDVVEHDVGSIVPVHDNGLF
jgi:predicted SnoaL-like aldol condensation-catalyzing enzyme